MTLKTLDDRREALEEAFFKKQNEELLADLRTKAEREHQREALAEAIDYHDDALLDRMIDVGLRAETWLAVSLVPLVEVAWADREVSAAEREVILGAAAEQGVSPDSDAGKLLEQWLETRPPMLLREAWKAYVSAVKKSVGVEGLEAFHEDTFTRARNVAKATNHLLGFGRAVTDAEGEVLADLESAF